jgi:DNA-binding transcriptional ArsR family regulator
VSKKQIPLSATNVKALRAIGFSYHEVSIVGVCLLYTDDCWCSTVPTSEILETLDIKQRLFYYTLTKLKGLGVVKQNHRYDYSEFVKAMEKTTIMIDNALEN